MSRPRSWPPAPNEIVYIGEHSAEVHAGFASDYSARCGVATYDIDNRRSFGSWLEFWRVSPVSTRPCPGCFSVKVDAADEAATS